MTDPELEVRFEADAVGTTGAVAVEVGRFTSRLAPRDGGRASEHGGHDLILWRREDGWRIERYVDLTAAGST